MILNTVLRPHGDPRDQPHRSIHVSVDIEGRSYVFVTFRLAGFGDRLRVPEPSLSIGQSQSRRQAAFLGVTTLQGAGVPAGFLLGGESDFGRTDELWRSTCFEVFAQLEGGRYAEFNISPSCQWAAYEFSSYREGMANLAGPVRVIRAERSGDGFELEAIVNWTDWPRITRIGLSAVIEDIDGAISYWALAHPPGKPDFHHPDSFALTLPPSETA